MTSTEPDTAGSPSPEAGAGDEFRSGFVAICGRPNVGKSTLLNALLGQDLAIATRFPQTTRERMLGVWTTDAFQAVLVDTPGIHQARSALNRYMVDEALRGAKDVDLILMLAEMPRLRDGDEAEAWQPGAGARAALDALAELGPPIVLVLTKCDRTARDLTLPVIARWQSLHPFVAVVPTSALERGGLDTLEAEIRARLPTGPHYYDGDQLTDRSMRWHAAECIRAELFAALREELPYACAVTVERYEERGERDRVHATIHVARRSQKGIVIGARGRTIKAISTAARARIAALTGRPCDLFVEVRVTADWTDDPKKLESLGYRGEGEA